MPSRFLKYALLTVPLLLAACGDGYEPVRTTAFPYGNQRTAGTGVAYVLAKMMPEKELKLEPAKAEPKPEPPPAPKVEPKPAPKVEEPAQPEVLEELQEMFRERQTK